MRTGVQAVDTLGSPCAVWYKRALLSQSKRAATKMATLRVLLTASLKGQHHPDKQVNKDRSSLHSDQQPGFQRPYGRQRRELVLADLRPNTSPRVLSVLVSVALIHKLSCHISLAEKLLKQQTWSRSCTYAYNHTHNLESLHVDQANTTSSDRLTAAGSHGKSGPLHGKAKILE